MIKGKKIILGISGGIAAYKMTNVASMLYKLGADVHVIMTKNACQFIAACTGSCSASGCVLCTFGYMSFIAAHN